MRKLLSVIVAALFAAASVNTIAQEKKAEKPAAEKSAKKEPTEAQKKQQERMKACNTQADDKKLKGDDRKKFMSGCLKPPAKKSEAKKSEPTKSEKK
ncbi:MAG TPA: PsiF family protein [Burkholderiales bacterium]|nr:PsiF family protein [Burkholderiales bacterium]